MEIFWVLKALYIEGGDLLNQLQLQLLFICIAHFNAIVLPKVLHNLK